MIGNKNKNHNNDIDNNNINNNIKSNNKGNLEEPQMNLCFAKPNINSYKT